MHILERIISLIAPHRCLSCGEEGSLLCHTCFQSVKPVLPRCYKCGKRQAKHICQNCINDTHFNSLTIASGYEGLAVTLISALKFGRSSAAVLPMAALLATRITSSPELITHVPTATGRIRQRGYDQSALLAKQLSYVTGIPYRPLLRRLGQQRQLGKDRSRRQQQLLSAYRTHRFIPESHRSVLLVDDVITTGSTLNAAAFALRKTGVSEVHAIVFAGVQKVAGKK